MPRFGGVCNVASSMWRNVVEPFLVDAWSTLLKLFQSYLLLRCTYVVGFSF